MTSIVPSPKLDTELIRKTFENLSYGPAPESDKVAKAWLDSHGRSFGHFIDNEWELPEGRKTYQTKNPATGEVLASTVQGTQEDVDKAVKVASQAYKTWSAASPHYRARILYSIARHVQKHARLVAVVEAMDNGKSIRETRDADGAVVVRHLYHHAGWASLKETEMKEWSSVGVVGAIVPWNFPLMLLVWKVAPALAMGNVVVLKPATYTRLSALLFAEICKEAGLPAGVFQVLTGSGAMGNMLATHRLVDKVAFTGSTEVGQILRRNLAGSGKKVSLELGGKSPVIVFEDADLDGVVEGVVDAIWFNQGQVCSAGSRLLVQESVYGKVVEKLKKKMAKLRLGDSLDKCVDMGALVDEIHLKSIITMVEEAREEGAEIYQACEAPTQGCFYPPTLVTNVQTSSKIVVEEVFGPVLVALPFRTPKEAVRLANNSIYGLAGSVWTEKLALALEVAMLIKAGTVWVNGHNLFDSAAGFGGYKMSGYGRDGGKEGLYEYVRPKGLKKAPLCGEGLEGFGDCLPGGLPCGSGGVGDGGEGGGGGAILPLIDRTYKMYYGGSQHRPDANYSRPIRSLQNQVIAHVGEGNRKDVRNAVEAANKALPGWSKRAGHNKAQILYYIAENLEQRKTEFSESLVSMLGCDWSQAEQEVGLSIERLFHWAAYADKYGGKVKETTLYGATVQINEAVGVVGIVCPAQSHPLLAFVSLLSAAISRSNCVVMVPSEKHPLVALMMYQIFDTSDLPGGVVNIVTGNSDHLTKYLAEHRDVQAMWYHGESAKASKFVEFVSAENMKRTWVDGGVVRDWTNQREGSGEEFLYHANQVKNIWLPMGDIYAN